MGPLLLFFVLTYLFSWTCWAAATVLTRDAAFSTAPLVAAIVYLGVFAPAIVAIALTARAGGRAGTAALLGRVMVWPERARWFLFAVLYMALIKVAAALLIRLGTGAWPPFGQESPLLMVLGIAASTPVQAGEEIGWRGYALPRLARRVGPGPAGIVLGVIWASWHLPLFFVGGGDTAGQSFPVYLAGVTALSVAMTWLYWRTGGSLLMTMLMHAAVNNTKDIVPSATPGATDVFTLSATPVAWVSAALLWTCAGYFLIRMRAAPARDGQP
jgi:membrane protease YdiL (CAAX protease family)